MELLRLRKTKELLLSIHWNWWSKHSESENLLRILSGFYFCVWGWGFLTALLILNSRLDFCILFFFLRNLRIIGMVQRSVPAPFLTKTYKLVDDPITDDVISWNENGTSFVVWNIADFAKDLLPNYFKHDNFCSFVRQLNTYVSSTLSSKPFTNCIKSLHSII